MDIKKIKKEIYRFNFINSELLDKFSILSKNEDGLDEFLIALKRTDFENGISVIPSGYTDGLFYSALNEGEIYSSPYKIPDLVNFRLSLDGLTRNGWYRIKFIVRDYGANDDVSTIANDKRLYVTTSKNELLFDEDIELKLENVEYSAMFKSTANEIDVIVKMGSIVISDIIIEEVELNIVEEVIEDRVMNVFGEGKYKLHGWGIYNMNTNIEAAGNSFVRLTQISGQGISLFFDTKNDELCLERDNVDTTIAEPFTDNSYVVELNNNKMIQYDGSLLYDSIVPTCVDSSLSPNSRELGFIKYAFIKEGQKIKYSNENSHLTIMIWKIA